MLKRPTTNDKAVSLPLFPDAVPEVNKLMARDFGVNEANTLAQNVVACMNPLVKPDKERAQVCTERQADGAIFNKGPLGRTYCSGYGQSLRGVNVFSPLLLRFGFLFFHTHKSKLGKFHPCPPREKKVQIQLQPSNDLTELRLQPASGSSRQTPSWTSGQCASTLTA